MHVNDQEVAINNRARTFDYNVQKRDCAICRSIIKHVRPRILTVFASEIVPRFGVKNVLRVERNVNTTFRRRVYENYVAHKVKKFS